MYMWLIDVYVWDVCDWYMYEMHVIDRYDEFLYPQE
jgi:hypothetical protein